MTTPTMTLVDAITTRRSVKGFFPDPVNDDVLQAIFELATTAPSNCNTHPWTCYVTSREPLSDTVMFNSQ